MSAPEVKQEEPKVQPQTPSAPVAEASPPIKTEENQANWKAFREQREADRKAREEANKAREAAEKATAQKAAEAEALRAALEALANKPSHSNQTNYDTDESEEQKIARVVRQEVEKDRQREREERAKREKEELPDNLAKTYADFYQVCSSENMDYLEFHHPEIAIGYKHMPESMEKWTNLYKAVKKYVPNTNSKKDVAKADRNLQKPQSLSAPGMSAHGTQVGPPRVLDEATRAANWNRMQKALKGLS